MKGFFFIIVDPLNPIDLKERLMYRSTKIFDDEVMCGLRAFQVWRCFYKYYHAAKLYVQFTEDLLAHDIEGMLDVTIHTSDDFDSDHT
jgi:hypothetical protein